MTCTSTVNTCSDINDQFPSVFAGMFVRLVTCLGTVVVTAYSLVVRHFSFPKDDEAHLNHPDPSLDHFRLNTTTFAWLNKC